MPAKEFICKVENVSVKLPVYQPTFQAYSYVYTLLALVEANYKGIRDLIVNDPIAFVDLALEFQKYGGKIDLFCQSANVKTSPVQNVRFFKQDVAKHEIADNNINIYVPRPEQGQKAVVLVEQFIKRKQLGCSADEVSPICEPPKFPRVEPEPFPKPIERQTNIEYKLGINKTCLLYTSDAADE